MNAIQYFDGVKFQGQTKLFNFKVQQKISEATFCYLEATGILFLTRVNYLQTGIS